jgi:hypothetical protein
MHAITSPYGPRLLRRLGMSPRREPVEMGDDLVEVHYVAILVVHVE